MTPYETDISFLESLNARKIGDSFYMVDANEATYMISHRAPKTSMHIASWNIETDSNYNTADASDVCGEGELQKAFENIKKIALYLAEIGNLPEST